MTPGKYNLDVYRGDTYDWRFLLYSDADGTVPYVIGAATVAAEIRATSNSPPVATLGCVVTAPNIIDVTLTSTQSADLPAKGVWDLQLSYAGSPPVVRTVVRGDVAVTADVTDAAIAVQAARR